MKTLIGFVSVCLAVMAMGWVWADEELDLQERVEQERNRAEQADLEAVEREILAVREREESAQRREEERRRDASHAELEELIDRREAAAKEHGERHPEVRELSEAIENLEREIKRREDIHAHEHGEEGHGHHEHAEHHEREGAERREREHAMHRIEHLHAAANHLDEAGAHDVAKEIRHRAENMERDLHRHHPQEDLGRHIDELHEQMQEMRKAIEQLRDEVAELKKTRRTNRRPE